MDIKLKEIIEFCEKEHYKLFFENKEYFNNFLNGKMKAYETILNKIIENF